MEPAACLTGFDWNIWGSLTSFSSVNKHRPASNGQILEPAFGHHFVAWCCDDVASSTESKRHLIKKRSLFLFFFWNQEWKRVVGYLNFTTLIYLPPIDLTYFFKRSASIFFAFSVCSVRPALAAVHWLPSTDYLSLAEHTFFGKNSARIW